MLICEHCGTTFCEHEFHTRKTDADNCDLCPTCGDDFISIASCCKVCGEIKSEARNSKLDVYHICNACLNTYVARHNELIAQLLPPEYDTLCDVFGELMITI